MRIRKNAKTSAFLHTNSNLISHNHEPTLCLLNQSPWDIITFPSSSPSIHHLFDDFVTNYDVNFAANWSSPDLATAIQSAASTKNDCEYDLVNRNRNQYDDEKIRDYELLYKKEDELGFMCKGNIVDLQNDTVLSTHQKAQCGSKSRGTKKRAAAITPKQNEFYYYSGFGPTWGKKRGGLGDKCTTFNACDTTTISSSVYYKSDVDVDEDCKRAELVPTMMMQTTWSGQVKPEKEDFDYVEEDEREIEVTIEKTVKKRGRKPIKSTWSGYVKPEKEDFYYVEEDEREIGVTIEKTVKKRGRKPIKATWSGYVKPEKEDFYYVEEDELEIGVPVEKTVKKRGRKPIKETWSGYVKPEKEDFYYVEEDEREIEVPIEKTMKKRGRKPIKARSLKSLM